MRHDVTIWYTGAHYQLGRWQHGYGLWAVGAAGSQPLAQWPETPEGWSAAWAWFTAHEPAGAIVHHSGPAAAPPAAGAGTRPVTAVILLAVGIVCGIAGLFPGYVSGSSLAGQPAELVPHAFYLAAWTASALLILSGGLRRRAGALLGLGASAVAFGFFLADAGTVIAGAAWGPGLVLGAIGWLACTAGTAAAVRGPATDAPGRPRADAAGPLATLVAAAVTALGAAIAFAPSWDSFTLRTSAGVTQTVTAGNSFANPGPVIAGYLAVMVALVVVVVTAALWRPPRLGAALLAGAAIPMVAQVVSAIVQVGEAVSPTAFGISPGQATSAGLTISNGLTPAFWIYVAFVSALLVTGVWMLVAPGAAARPHVPPVGTPWDAPPAGTAAVAAGDEGGSAGRYLPSQ